MVEQPTEWLQTDASLPNVLVTVELRSASGLCVIAVPYPDVLEADGFVEVLERLVESLFRNEVIPRDVTVACVNACRHRNMRAQQLNKFSDLLEAAA